MYTHLHVAPAIGIHFDGCLDTFLGTHCVFFSCLFSCVYPVIASLLCLIVVDCSYSCSLFILCVLLRPVRIVHWRLESTWLDASWCGRSSCSWSRRQAAAVRCYLFWCCGWTRHQMNQSHTLIPRTSGGVCVWVVSSLSLSVNRELVSCNINIERIDVDVAATVTHTHTHRHTPTRCLSLTVLCALLVLVNDGCCCWKRLSISFRPVENVCCKQLNNRTGRAPPVPTPFILCILYAIWLLYVLLMQPGMWLPFTMSLENFTYGAFAFAFV